MREKLSSSTEKDLRKGIAKYISNGWKQCGEVHTQKVFSEVDEKTHKEFVVIMEKRGAK
jgi:hypothetical protein